jgi:hypothetical protein
MWQSIVARIPCALPEEPFHCSAFSLKDGVPRFVHPIELVALASLSCADTAHLAEEEKRSRNAGKDASASLVIRQKSCVRAVFLFQLFETICWIHATT